MKKLSITFAILAIIISNIMCVVVSFTYRDYICAVEHHYTSAPAEIALLYIIPFAITIAICLILSVIFYKKSKKVNKKSNTK